MTFIPPDNTSLLAWAERSAQATRAVLPKGGPLTWLLRQSMHTHIQRLALLPTLGLSRGPVRIADVGAGTGAVSLDLAWLCGEEAHITAVDHDPHGMSLLQDMASLLDCRLDTRIGSAYALPIDDSSQDLTSSRFLFQHLDRPDAALDEMVRVTRPGGRIAVVEVDDGAWLSCPDEVPELRRLNGAVRLLQASKAAGRTVGRQLYRMFRAAGLTDLQVLAVPRVRLGTYHGRNEELEAHHKEFYLGQRDRLIEAGLLSEPEFDDAMTSLEDSFGRDDFGFACEFVALGRVAMQ